jgi:hypothetical protein
MRIRTAVVLTLLAGALTACDDDPPGPQAPTRLRLNLSGLEALAGGFHYEGWVILGGQPVSTGKFDIGAGGALVTIGGAQIPNNTFDVGRDIGGASAVVITIEPTGDVDAMPAQTKILAGNVANAAATLGIAAPQALGTDFGGASGRFILATPTTAATTDELSGIWFIDLSGGSPAAGLTLPALPSGWRYEGWAVIDGTPVTSGRFLTPTGADASAPFSGPDPGPPFPGEDFIQNAPAGLAFPTSLAGDMAVISVEPEPDDGPAPFALKPLVGTILQNATDHVTYMMQRNAASFPSGVATIVR